MDRFLETGYHRGSSISQEGRMQSQNDVLPFAKRRLILKDWKPEHLKHEGEEVHKVNFPLKGRNKL